MRAVQCSASAVRVVCNGAVGALPATGIGWAGPGGTSRRHTDRHTHTEADPNRTRNATPLITTPHHHHRRAHRLVPATCRPLLCSPPCRLAVVVVPHLLPDPAMAARYLVQNALRQQPRAATSSSAAAALRTPVLPRNLATSVARSVRCCWWLGWMDGWWWCCCRIKRCRELTPGPLFLLFTADHAEHDAFQRPDGRHGVEPGSPDGDGGRMDRCRLARRNRQDKRHSALSRAHGLQGCVAPGGREGQGRGRRRAGTRGRVDSSPLPTEEPSELTTICHLGCLYRDGQAIAAQSGA